VRFCDAFNIPIPDAGPTSGIFGLARAQEIAAHHQAWRQSLLFAMRGPRTKVTVITRKAMAALTA